MFIQDVFALTSLPWLYCYVYTGRICADVITMVILLCLSLRYYGYIVMFIQDVFALTSLPWLYCYVYTGRICADVVTMVILLCLYRTYLR